MVTEADNLIRILREAKEAIARNDSYQLKTLSDQTIHAATIYQDTDNILVAVIVYSMAKIVERETYKRMSGWNEFYANLLKNLDLAIYSIEKNQPEKLLVYLGTIRNLINEIDGDLTNYIRDIFYKAEINKAFKLYEHGLSAEKTASLLGVSLWDLATYIGQSTVSESHHNESIPAKDRIKLTMDFFK
jgi:hypothetical protein